MSYSKTKVNRAGELLSAILLTLMEGEELADETRRDGREALEIVEWWREQHARPLSRVAANLRYYAAKEDRPLVAQRLKRGPTIAHKLLRQPGMKLSRMADIGGVRAVLPSQEASYRVAATLRRNWTITRFRDYVREPKTDGYRALHLINRHRGHLIEVQLRTPNQDFWANNVEAIARGVAPGLKSGGGPPELTEYIREVAEVLAMQDRGESISGDLLADIAELHNKADTFIASQ